jgi:hypothetical protein
MRDSSQCGDNAQQQGKNGMKYILCAFFLLIVDYSAPVQARLIIDGPRDFKAKVISNLSEAKACSRQLAALIRNLQNATAAVTIKPITSDKSTWHVNGEKSRSHTEALDGKSRADERNISTNSIIYINTNRITRTHKSYNSGTLIHELVHAYDLSFGKYHGSYPIREKRAVFFQNIWRDAHSVALRTNYHARFETNEYQKAKEAGRLNWFAKYCFEHNDTP